MELIDYDPISGHMRWKRAIRGGCQAGDGIDRPAVSGIIRARVGGQLYAAHRLAWKIAYGVDPAGVIDHINGNRADNRITNLRDVSQQQNSMNSRKRKAGSSRLKGVSYHGQSGRWRARIMLDRREISLGLFATEAEAYEAYCKAAMRHHGEFANRG